MKVLLTGASGLVGSHVLDGLRRAGLPVRLLLRPTSSTAFIEAPGEGVEILRGSLESADGLAAALEGVTHVIHCAGATKALDREGYFRVNHSGTLNLVAAINRHAPQLERLVHISSLAVSGPATSARPAQESDPPRPLTDYARSKLAGEQAVREQCRVPYVILRPPGVYGPRDGEFLKLFRAIRCHLLPLFSGGRQELSLVYAPDLAAAAVHCLTHPQAAGQIFNVAHPEVVTVRRLAETAAALMPTWTLPLPLPGVALWPVCLGQEMVAQLRRRPNVVNLQKYRELTAAGWVCDVSRLRQATGFTAPTALTEGLRQTLAWCRQAGWLS